tara:strand:+ start:60 stop:1271 length:1212 start_codon:yes stop_codon:yes gene_type:complete
MIQYDSTRSWFRAFLLFILAVIGTVGMWSVVVFIPEIENEFKVDRGTSSLLYAATMIGFGFGTVIIGKIFDKHGIKKPIVIASISLIISYYLYSISIYFWNLLFLQAFMGFAAAAFFGPAMADITNFFNNRRGLALSIVASANYVAGASWPLVISFALNFVDWRTTHFWISIFCLVSMLPILGFLKNYKNIQNEEANIMSSKDEPSIKLSNNQLQIILMFAGVCCCVAMSMPQVHMVALCVDNGFGLQVGTEILAVMLYSGMISRIVFGFLSDKIGPLPTILLGSFLQMVSLVFFLPFNSQLSLYMVSLMFGLSQGGIVPAYAIIIRKYLPLQQAGVRVGLVLGATIVGMALGGWISGEIFDLTQSYYLAFVNGILWNLLNILAIIYVIFKSDLFNKNKLLLN